MTKNTGKKIKGNKDDAKHFVDFFNPDFFGIVDDDETTAKKDKTVSLTVPIDDAVSGRNKTNLTEHKIPEITDFTDVERVIKSIQRIRNSVLPSKTGKSYSEFVKNEIRFIKLICCTGTVHSTFERIAEEARAIVFNKYLKDIMIVVGDEQEREITVKSHSTFCERIEQCRMSNGYLDFHFPEDTGLGNLDRPKQQLKMQEKMYRNYHQEFWTGLHQEMFGANRYRAFQLELEYLKHHIVKPYDVSARKAVQRIDVLLTYLPFFPPRTLRDKRPTENEWKRFNAMSVATPEAKRDIQYAMLPINFRDSIDTWETDYETMNETIFLQRLEQVEKKDSRERKEREDNKEKLKRKSDANNHGKEHPNNNRKDKSDRDTKRNRRDGQKSTNAGKQRFCNMCKIAGAPSFVYETHNDKECKKKDQYEKLLSGGAGKRYEAKKEYKSFESKMMKKMNSEFKKLQSKKKKRGSKKDDSDEDDMSVDSDGTNTSY